MPKTNKIQFNIITNSKNKQGDRMKTREEAAEEAINEYLDGYSEALIDIEVLEADILFILEGWKENITDPRELGWIESYIV